MPVHTEDVSFRIDKTRERVVMTFADRLTDEEKASIRDTLKHRISGATRVSPRGCLVIIAGLGPWGEGITSHLQEVFTRALWPVTLHTS
jgi:hypothetical protein